MAPILESDREESPDHNTEPSGKHAFADESYYMKALHLSNVLSNEHDNLKHFFNTKLPELISRTTKGKSHLNVLGIGSGAGEMDLHILSTIQKLEPDLRISSETIEPIQKQIDFYKANLSNMPDLKGVTFTWHRKTTAQYEQDAKSDITIKTFDFIHMIQMAYYIKSVKETLEFFISCLSPEGKLIIILITRDCGWHKLLKKHQWLFNEEYSLDLCSEDISDILDTISVKYETYDIDSYIDITECFVEGSEVGEMLLDVITEKSHFAKTAPIDRKAKIMEDLLSPKLSARKDGKILLDTRIKAIVVG
ncbi:histamine N-methyltransferase-like isoform 1-T2 [Mantella aurantiaca]